MLRDASTGRRYRVRPGAAQDVDDALSLAADISADERKIVLERARRNIKAPKPPEKAMTDEDKRRAELFWYDHTLTTKEAVEKVGFAERTLYRELGRRLRPGGGKAVTKRRTNPDG